MSKSWCDRFVGFRSWLGSLGGGCFGLLGLIVVGCHSPAGQGAGLGESFDSVSLTLSAAASLQPVLEAIAPSFHQAHPKIEIAHNFAASGKLQQQIQQGAPVDLFFSASDQQINALAAQGLLLPNSRHDLLTNGLVLIAPVNSTLNIDQMDKLSAPSIERIAVGEFRSVPAGQYAKQMLEQLNLFQPLQRKFVLANSALAILAATESGNVDLGLVYETDAARSSRVKVLATAPPGSHSPIVYPIAVIQGSEHPQAAQAYITFLQGDVAQATFQDFGFGLASESQALSD